MSDQGVGTTEALGAEYGGKAGAWASKNHYDLKGDDVYDIDDDEFWARPSV
jgi:hypothetical protein